MPPFDRSNELAELIKSRIDNARALASADAIVWAYDLNGICLALQGNCEAMPEPEPNVGERFDATWLEQLGDPQNYGVPSRVITRYHAHVWLHSLSPLLSPVSGRRLGTVVITMLITGAVTATPMCGQLMIGRCPLGAAPGTPSGGVNALTPPDGVPEPNHAVPPVSHR